MITLENYCGIADIYLAIAEADRRLATLAAPAKEIICFAERSTGDIIAEMAADTYIVTTMYITEIELYDNKCVCRKSQNGINSDNLFPLTITDRRNQ